MASGKEFLPRFRGVMLLIVAFGGAWMPGQTLAQSVGHFNRIQLQLDGLFSAPTDNISGYGSGVSLLGHWVLVPGLVAEMGVGRSQERYKDFTAQEVHLVSQHGHLGLRWVVPPPGPWRASAAVRAIRGRLAVDQEEWRRVQYHWVELGVHFAPDASRETVTLTVRQYLWADGSEDAYLTGEWIQSGWPWAWGVSAELGLTTQAAKAGLSLNHRF